MRPIVMVHDGDDVYFFGYQGLLHRQMFLSAVCNGRHHCDGQVREVGVRGGEGREEEEEEEEWRQGNSC